MQKTITPGWGPVKILQQIKPNLIVTTDDIDPAYHNYLIAAKFLKIPTLLVQPGIISEQPFNLKTFKLLLLSSPRIKRIIKDYQQLWIPLTEMKMNFFIKLIYLSKDLWSRFFRGTGAWGHGGCTKISVTGDFLKEILIKQGVPEKNIVVTGQPRFDSIYRSTQKKEKFIRDLKTKKKKNKIILYLPDASYQHLFTSEQTYFDTTRNTIKTCQQIQNTTLIIKPHPDENPDVYSTIINDLHSDAMVYEGSNLHDLIRVSDLVITGTSTTGLETLMLNKPLVVISFHTGENYFSNNYEYIPFIKEKVAFTIQQNEDFYPTINTALYDKEKQQKLTQNRKKFVYHHTYLQDGKASERVADLIQTLI